MLFVRRIIGRLPAHHCILIALAIAGTDGAAAQSRRMTLADLGREVGLEQPRLSPDGKSVVLITRRINYQDNRFERALVLIDIASGNRRIITPGRRNVGSPQWSPTGDRIAFLDAEDDKPAQLYILPTTGGEARRVTDVKRGVEGFAWRPDGSSLAFLTEEILAEKTGDERHNKSFEVGDNVYLAQAAPLPRHVWLVPADGGTATRVTSGSESVSWVGWMPDGGSIVMRTQPSGHSGATIHSKAVVRDVASGTERSLGPARGFASQISVSPDGRHWAALRPRGPELGFRTSELVLTPTAGGEGRSLTSTFDRTIQGVTWFRDNSALLIQAPEVTRIGVWVQPLSGSLRRLDLGPIDPVSEIQLGADNSAVFIGEVPNGPGELYHLATLDATPKRLTDFNAELAGLELGRVETVRWDGPDGFKENGVLIYPPGFTAGKQYPLVLDIHGGPMGTSTEGWSAFDQLLAAQGWIVFQPNYRGSTNMGDAFQRAVVNDAGDGPGRDVMAGVKAVKALGVVDENRVGVSGWSYGGYMTAWLTANYQGWRAAMAGAAVTDWFDWYNLADMNVWAGFGLGGSPWRNNNAANYWKQSPMAYAHQIRTPTLILSTTGDPRVTVTQSYKLYHALKDNGVEVKFVAYPVGGHFPPDPVHQRDLYRRWIEWMAQHFNGATSTSSR